MRVIYQGSLEARHIAASCEQTWFYVPETGEAVQVNKLYQMGDQYRTSSPILEWLALGVQVIIIVDEALPVLRSIWNQLIDWITATKEEKAAIKAVRLAKKVKK